MSWSISLPDPRGHRCPRQFITIAAAIPALSNPFTRVEDGAIDNLVVLGVGLLLIAVGVWVADRRMQGDGDAHGDHTHGDVSVPKPDLELQDA